MEPRNPSLTDQHVGRKLRARRLELQLSQQELADRLGVTFQQLQKYERGANRISAGRLFELARALETRITYFYDGLDLSAVASRRGVAEEAAGFAHQPDEDARDLLDAFQRIKDPATRKTILSMVKDKVGGERAPREAGSTRRTTRTPRPRTRK